MKFLLLLIFVPHFAMASALVMKDDLNKIFNVIAVLDFPENGISDSVAAEMANDADLYLNSLAPEFEIAGETWTVLFNFDSQLGYKKYPLSDSCAHNRMSLDKDFNRDAFVTGFILEIIDLPFSTLVFEKDLACFGSGSPLEI
jgi:hypothetical protein